ncbi:IS1096 element passenger TnpR family protein [Desulfobacter vibrioformis]|uniref:IS1096 element passenger TnpR family protein n=1 Tax=Desulfobacter vibrioformis TaxID=34031 RepID=UPI0005516B7A|nr:hypothetical protein [Desulfobacter vibrioformis]
MNNIVYLKQPKKIWTLRIKLQGAEPEWVRVIEIDWRASFLDLHEAIQKAVDFDNDHLFEFYVGRHPRHVAQVVGGAPDWEDFHPVNTYQRVPISSAWPMLPGLKLFYLFDFGDNWVFQINKTRHKDKEAQPGVVYPRVIKAKGENPEQYPDYEDWDDE